jgi:hypothetical protein
MMQQRINNVEELRNFIIESVDFNEGNFEIEPERPSTQVFFVVVGKPADVAKTITENTGLQFEVIPYYRGNIYATLPNDMNIYMHLTKMFQHKEYKHLTTIMANLDAEHKQWLSQYMQPFNDE